MSDRTYRCEWCGRESTSRYTAGYCSRQCYHADPDSEKRSESTKEVEGCVSGIGCLMVAAPIIFLILKNKGIL